MIIVTVETLGTLVTVMTVVDKRRNNSMEKEKIRKRGENFYNKKININLKYFVIYQTIVMRISVTKKN